MLTPGKAWHTTIPGSMRSTRPWHNLPISMEVPALQSNLLHPLSNGAKGRKNDGGKANEETEGCEGVQRRRSTAVHRRRLLDQSDHCATAIGGRHIACGNRQAGLYADQATSAEVNQSRDVFLARVGRSWKNSGLRFRPQTSIFQEVKDGLTKRPVIENF